MWPLLLTLFGVGFFSKPAIGIRGVQGAISTPKPVSVSPKSPYPQLPVSYSFGQWKPIVIIADQEMFGGWFQKNNLIDLVCAMIMVESSGGRFLVREVSQKDTSYGLMQVTPYTAKDIYDRGKYRLFPPTQTVLMTTKGGLYFGMSYIKMLWELHGIRGYENLSRAYNGGAGVVLQPQKFRAAYNQTTLHWRKINNYV